MYADSNRAGGYFYAGKTRDRRFRGGQEFFDPQIVLPERSGRQFLSQKSRGSLKKAREIADYVFFQHTKTNITNC